MSYHHLDSFLASGHKGINRKKNHAVEQAQGIVNQHGTAIVPNDFRAVGSHQVGKISAQSQRSDGHNHAYEFHNDIIQVDKQLTHRAFVAAAGGYAEAENNGKNNQGKHIGLGPQLRKIRYGQGGYDQLSSAFRLAHLGTGHLNGSACGRAENVHPNQHADRGNGPGKDESADGAAQNPAQPLHVGHAAYSGSNGHKHQRNHNGKQQIQEDIANGLNGSTHRRGKSPDEGAHQNAP